MPCGLWLDPQAWPAPAPHCVLPWSRRRKAREQKQYSKQVQAEKVKERTATKKRQIEDVSKMRKQREKSVRGRLLLCRSLPVPLPS